MPTLMRLGTLSLITILVCGCPHSLCAIDTNAAVDPNQPGAAADPNTGGNGAANGEGNENSGSSGDSNTNGNGDSYSNVATQDIWRAGTWHGLLSATIQTTVDGVPGETLPWSPSPGVGVRFDELGNLAGISSLANNPYYRSTDGSRIAVLSQVGDSDTACVGSRLASAVEIATLTTLEIDAQTVRIIFTSTFGGHAGSTTISNGQATQTIGLEQRFDGLLRSVAYICEFDVRELAGSQGGFVMRHVVESAGCSGLLTRVDPSELVEWTDTCVE